MGRKQPRGWQGFGAQPELLLILDQIGRRYGMLPHQVLDLDPWQLSLALECAQQADSTSGQMVDRITNNGGMVFPVVVLRD